MDLMDDWVIEKIQQINREFYQKFAISFSATRGQVQPGVARLLKDAPDAVNWLDIGCGNGTLAGAWVEQGRAGCYCGCDFSRPLLDEAAARLAGLAIPQGMEVDFRLVDLSSPDWPTDLPVKNWDVVSMFAVLHHLPSQQKRQLLVERIREIIPSGNPFYLSVWQLQNSPRLLPRVKPWEMVGIPHREVEEGDVLMDWRAGLEEKDASEALRYVHVFNETELQSLARSVGFRVADSFYSDGKEGNLALYQIWR